MEGRKLVQVNAEMTCEGCSGAITKILQKIPGIGDINCSIPEQKVTFTAPAEFDPQDALRRLLVWGEAAGKRVSLVG